MFKPIKNLTMYRLMSYALDVLIAITILMSLSGLLPFVWWHIALTWLYLIAVSYSGNFIISKIRQIKPNFESQIITASILTLILGPMDPVANFVSLALVALGAQLSKYLFVFRNRHIFNPAALGALLGGLFLSSGASWWAGNIFLIPFILILGWLIMEKLRWWHLPIAFLGTYLALFLAVFQIRPTLALIAPLTFFAFVMLIEPLTAPSGKWHRVYYGAFIAAVLILLQKFTPVPYSLELSLLIGNVFARVIAPNPRLIFKFLRKAPESAAVQTFYFEPVKRFDFTPGQFLEWSLPHPNADSRGMRRWFTISSSPTEKEITISTKLSDKSSSFKLALQNLKPGQELSAIAPDGEFVLPKNGAAKIAFIAGGIGITPFRSIIKFLVDKKLKRDIVLLHSLKTESDAVFQPLFDQAKDFLRTEYIITDKVGFITPEMIKQKIPDWQSRIFYVSGPEPMVEAFEKMLKDMGLAANQIKTDFFPGYEETHTK